MADVIRERVATLPFADAVVRGLEPHVKRFGDRYSLDYKGSQDLRFRKGSKAGGYLGRLMHDTIDVDGSGFSSEGSRPDKFAELSIVAIGPGEGTGRRVANAKYPNGDQFSEGETPSSRDWDAGSIIAEAVLSLFAIDLSERDAEPIMHALHLGKTTMDSETGRIIRTATIGQPNEFFEATLAGEMIAQPTATLTVVGPKASSVLTDRYGSQALPERSGLQALYNASPNILQVAAILAVRTGTGRAQQGVIPMVGASAPLAFG